MSGGWQKPPEGEGESFTGMARGVSRTNFCLIKYLGVNKQQTIDKL